MCKLFLLLLFIVVQTSLHAQTMTMEDSTFIKSILKVHHKYRQEVGNPDLVWSSELAISASKWVKHLLETNKPMHDPDYPEGENIWWGSGVRKDYEDMVEFWASEKKDYVYGPITENGPKVGHYTQMIWKTTTKVGCALGSNNTRTYLVCRYTPMGNTIGQKPY